MFTHLHVHTEFSLLDGMCRIPQLVARAKELGMNSLAITDHGVLHGAIAFYQAAKAAGIKPIIGCEVYVADGSRLGRTSADRTNYHLTLLARDAKGYHNLIQLVTRAHLEGFYYKPRVDKELLTTYHEGIIALSGCAQGSVPRRIIQNRMEDAEIEALWYKELFGEFYFEIQRHPIPELAEINKGLDVLARKLNIPVVATNDVHYVNKADAPMQDILLCIGTNTTVTDEKRLKMPGDYFYLKSPEEMSAEYSDLPEAIANTQQVADMVDLNLEFNKLHFPEMKLPPGKQADDHLSDLCWDGIKKRYDEPSELIKQRLTYELDVIRKTNFAHYFLVVKDIISFVREHSILFGVRGSAAASLVLYCLYVTDIDPMAHRLVFERFLNIERREMPDIDMDFQDNRRDEVIDYVTQKYGSSHVAQIITFGTMGARAAVRDVGRALGMPYSHVDRVARLIPVGPNVTLAKALEENKEMSDIYNQDELVKRLIDTAQNMEGISRHASTHAAGVVISKNPITEYLPLQRAGKAGREDTCMTQYAMEDVARLGLLKMDFLGLINLRILDESKQIIAESRHVEIDLLNLPMDDPKTFKLLASGDTGGVFQLESTGMRRNIRELKPTTFSDIAAMIALYRPGPMQHIPTFIKAKQGLEPIHFAHPSLNQILEETYGVIVYQDQVLLIVQALAGYTLGEADIFRKAMGKKIADVMKKEKQRYLDKAAAKGVTPEIANEVFTLIEPFAGYAFNKAHSVSYAMIAYQTAYLKANYPVEYMTAFMNSYVEQTERLTAAIADCRHMGISVLPPNVNRSHAGFAIEKIDGTDKYGIRFGLACIKNVSENAVQPIIEARRSTGSFKSIEALCRAVDLHNVNRKVLESLIKAGAFDDFGKRGGLLQCLDRILSMAHEQQKLRDSGQSSMFDLFGQNVPAPLPQLDLPADDLPTTEKLSYEKELLGVYFSDHPFAAVAAELSSTTTLCGQVTGEMVGEQVTIAGIVASVRELQTKEHKPFAIVTLEDLDGSIEVTVWPAVYERTQSIWQTGAVILVEGTVKMREDRPSLNCQRARVYRHEEKDTQPSQQGAPVADSPIRNGKRHLIINLAADSDSEESVSRLHTMMDALKRYPGQDKVWLSLDNGSKTVKVEFNQMTVRCCAELLGELKQALGSGDFTVV